MQTAPRQRRSSPQLIVLLAGLVVTALLRLLDVGHLQGQIDLEQGLLRSAGSGDGNARVLSGFMLFILRSQQAIAIAHIVVAGAVGGMIVRCFVLGAEERRGLQRRANAIYLGSGVLAGSAVLLFQFTILGGWVLFVPATLDPLATAIFVIAGIVAPMLAAWEGRRVESSPIRP